MFSIDSKQSYSVLVLLQFAFRYLRFINEFVIWMSSFAYLHTLNRLPLFLLVYLDEELCDINDVV